MGLAQENQHGKSSSGMALTGLTSPPSTTTPNGTSHPCPFPSYLKLKAPVWLHCHPATSLTSHPAPKHCSVKAYSTFSVRKEKETRYRKEQAENNSQSFSKSNVICFICLVAWWYCYHYILTWISCFCTVWSQNSITGITRGKEASSLKHKQEPRKQKQIEELKGRLREKETNKVSQKHS